MAPDSQTLAQEKAVHRGHRDQIAALFQARPFQIVRSDTLEALVGRNYQQRISEARLATADEHRECPAPRCRRKTADRRLSVSA